MIISIKIKKKFNIFKKNKVAFYSLLFLLFLILLSYMNLFFNLFPDPMSDEFVPCQNSSWKHLMGTDTIGRDLFSRLLTGFRLSFQIAFVAVAISAIFGTILGILAGYFAGLLDYLINFLCDVLIVIPSILVIILIMLFFGQDFKQLIFALAITNILFFIRSIRICALENCQHQFIKSLEALGASHLRIICKHIFPAVVPTLFVMINTSISGIILSIASLGFLGLGLDNRIPECGSILSYGLEYIMIYPHLVFFPSIMILIISLSFNFIGYGLSDMFDPKKQNI